MPTLYSKEPKAKPLTIKQLLKEKGSPQSITIPEGFLLKRGQRVYYTIELTDDPFMVKCTAAESNATKKMNLDVDIYLL